MAATIRSVKIRNFRSIKDLNAQLSEASVFVGSNDVGKSNILRALNLFFNDQTNPGFEFDFDDDYNFHSPKRKGKAREISVTLEISLPHTYQKTNGQVVIWKKTWREDGLWGEEYDYFGQRITRNSRGREVREKVDIPDKSNVHSLLRKIEFEYVPAVKDNEFFDDLRGRIYGIISEVASQAFHESSSAFEDAIGEHVSGLTSSIFKSLKIKSKLALPRDLYHIFERLDFLSGDQAVSLNNRGDGIKARHIPLILKFMAQKKGELLRRGGAPISSIWAYEEPENNLEIASAVKLADEMYEIAKSGTAQVVFTTHSPAFYDLGLQNEDVSLNYVKRSSDAEGTQIASDNSELDSDLGTLALLGSRIPDLIEKVRSEEVARHEAEELAKENRANLFVEGESDKLILERCLSLFFPSVEGKVSVTTKRSGGGDNYVVDMLEAWRFQHKHHSNRPLAAGVLDTDAEGKKNEFNKKKKVTDSAKCFCYKKPKHIIPALREGFSIPATLEIFYPLSIWEAALEKGDLKERDLTKVLPKRLHQRILQGTETLDDHKTQPWWIFAEYDFTNEAKISTAEQISRLPDDTAREYLQELEPIILEILRYLKCIE